MYLNVSKRDGRRKYLSIQKSFWNKETKSRTSTTIMSLGFLDVLEKEFDDPISHFKELAKTMTVQENETRHILIDIDMNEELPDNARGTYNFGYAVPMKIYHDLLLDDFFKRKMVGKKFDYNTNSIMIMLTMSRILAPASKKKSYEDKGRFFERFDFSLDDVNNSLLHYAEVSTELQQSMHERITSKYGSDTGIVYYDVTNYYFQIDEPDEKKKNAKSKGNQKKVIIQMGLVMDADGVPIHYKLFPGNTLDKETFRSVIGDIKLNYNTGRVIVVADMGSITGDNIYYLTDSKQEKPLNGYVFSISVHGSTDKFKEYVLDRNGYCDINGKPVGEDADFMIKSRIEERDINVSMSDGEKITKQVNEKQVVFWNRKYYNKARADRAEVLAKAEKLIKSPSAYTKATSYGASAYVLNIDYDKKTGEIKGKGGKALLLDSVKIAEQEKLDGYHCIITSELDMTDNQIIDIYLGRWDIEKTFKITKSALFARPVHVKANENIDAHFFICFISLVIIRLIQKKMDKNYSAAKIIECLNKIECIQEHENIYLFGYKSELSVALGKAFNIDFSKKRLPLNKIKQILADVKK